MPGKETQVRSPVGKPPHATEQLSPCVTQLLSQCFRTRELQLLVPVRPCACAPQQEKPLQRGLCPTTRERPPLAATREEPRRSNEDLAQPKMINEKSGKKKRLWSVLTCKYKFAGLFLSCTGAKCLWEGNCLFANQQEGRLGFKEKPQHTVEGCGSKCFHFVAKLQAQTR